MSGPLCARCKRWVSQSGDSWCAACTATEVIQGEWCRTWQPAYRRIAQDLVISVARQIRAIRSVAAGVSSTVAQQVTERTKAATADRSRAKVETSDLREEASPVDHREDLPRRRTTQPKVLPKPDTRSAGQSDETSDEEEETDVESTSKGKRKASPAPDPDHRPIKEPKRKPPDPDSRQHRPQAERGKQDKPPPDSLVLKGRAESSQGHRKEDRRRRRHRAGRKHQRHYRLLEDPTLRVHHKPGEDFFALQEEWKDEDLK